jgi:biopolymer transport protein ExbD
MALTQANDDEVMATINITPFTDVLLVLLIIFIILTSVSREQKLPDAKNTQAVQDSQIFVNIDKDDHVLLGAESVTIAQLPAAFRHLADATGHRYSSVTVKADPHATYGTLIAVMDAAKAADLTNFGLANHVEGAH